MAWEGAIWLRLEREHKNPINTWVRNIHRLFPASSLGINRNTALLPVFLYSSCPARPSHGELDLPLPRAAIRIFTNPLQHVQMIYISAFTEGREKVMLEVIDLAFPCMVEERVWKHLLLPPCPRFPWVSQFLHSSNCWCHVTGHLSPEKHSSTIQTATYNSGF